MTAAYSWDKLTRADTSVTVSPRSGHALFKCKAGILCFGGIDGRKNDQGVHVPNSDLYLLRRKDGMLTLIL
jgi:hypothetical protein